MHRLRVVLLGKGVGADGVIGLFQLELLKQPHNFWIDINCPYLAALGCVQVDIFLRCVAEISSDHDRTGLEVDIFPL